MNHGNDAIAIQNRCIHCLREQYAMAVIGVSEGIHPCVWCGVLSWQMTEAEYRQTLAERRERKHGL